MKILANLTTLSLLTLMTVGCSSIATPTTPQASIENSADRVLIDGDIYTVDDDNPNAEAIAIKNGKIIYVGNNEGVQSFIGANTHVDDLNGKFVLPGFIDTHAHFALGALTAQTLMLNHTDSPEKWLADIKKYAEDHPNAKGILGMGFMVDKFGKEGPTKEMLDKIVPDRPVVIVGAGAHTAWFNSKAYEMAGITKDTPDPIPGVQMYKRKANGEPSGLNLEAMTIYPLIAKLNLIEPKQVENGAEKVFPLLSAVGLTAYYDAGMMQMESLAYPALQKLEQQGKLPVKVSSSYMVQSPTQVPIAIKSIKALQSKYQSELIRPNTIKIHNDGVIEAHTAGLLEDYSNDKGNKGGILLKGATLQNFVADIAKNDINAHIHAIGDRTVSEALDAVEFARKQAPKSKSRFAIAHVILADEKDLPRFGELDVVAQTTPIWITLESENNPNIGKDRARQQYRIKSMENGGAKITFGSDFPVGGDMGLMPLSNIEAGITRKGFDNKAQAFPLKSEKMSLESMIKGYTINASYQLGMDDEIGSLEVGKSADLVVLSDNLFKIKPTEIHNVKVKETIMNGKTTYTRKWYYGLMGY